MRFPFFRNRDSVKNGILISIRRTGDGFHPGLFNYTNLFEGGWCDEVPEEKEYLVSKTVILTEGSTDARVISEAMKLLYPHMVKFYSFIDFST